MAKNWPETVTPYPSSRWGRKEILDLAKRRLIFLLWLPGSDDFIIPDFQMRGHSISPWVAPLLGSLLWIEDKTPRRDKSGVARARWLYRRHAYLSEIGLAVIGHRPPNKEISAARDVLDFFEMPLERKPRSFAEIFAFEPRLAIDYQYWLQGVRWDAIEYHI